MLPSFLMGRPSVQAERREEILVAFETCVARYGIEGATLERIAEVSGLSRPLIRHHAGNRGDLIIALGERFTKRAGQLTDFLVQDLPDNDRAAALLQRLFGDEGSDFEEVLLAEELIAASLHHPDLEKVVVTWLHDFHEAICDQLRLAYPKANDDKLRIVTTGVVGIYFNASSLEPLSGLDQLGPDSHEAARLLVEGLE